MAEKYRRKPNAACLICGKSTYKRPCEIRRNKGRVFCSLACYGVACRKETACTVCKIPILASANKKTCSRGCANTHRTGIKYKMNRPKDKVRSQQALKIRLVRERGRNCERCAYNECEILEIHHKNRDRNNNDMSNLELICPNCHAKEHFRKMVD